MRIIVTGGRDYDAPAAVERVLGDVAGSTFNGVRITLVHGGAPGADQLAHWAALALGWTITVHPADWDAHGRAAGPIRNQAMADAGADLCIAFKGGRGTADMVRRARAAGIPVREVP